MIHRQMVEGFIGAQQRAYPIREKYAREREHSGGAELKEHPMAEHIVCAIHVPLADADGIDRHASNADEHIHRAYHQYGGTSQIDRPQRCNGCIEAIIIPGPGRICGFLGSDSEYIIPFECIKKIGEDIILVEICEEKCLHSCK